MLPYRLNPTACKSAAPRVSKGSRVRLRPGPRRSDAQDMFLAGKTARVEGVFFDVEKQISRSHA